MGFFSATLLCNFILGIVGIVLAVPQFGRSRVWFWLMVGSGILLCVPMVHHQLVLLLSRHHLFGGYRVLMNTYMPVAQFHAWTRWIAYALLLFGVLDLKNDRSEASLAGATLPAHPAVASDIDEATYAGPSAPADSADRVDPSNR